MLKDEVEEAVITETLRGKYINPLLDAATQNSEIKIVEETSVNDRVKGMINITSFPPIPPGDRKMTRTRRAQLLQKIISGQPIGHISTLN